MVQARPARAAGPWLRTRLRLCVARGAVWQSLQPGLLSRCPSWHLRALWSSSPSRKRPSGLPSARDPPQDKRRQQQRGPCAPALKPWNPLPTHGCLALLPIPTHPFLSLKVMAANSLSPLTGAGCNTGSLSRTATSHAHLPSAIGFKN